MVLPTAAIIGIPPALTESVACCAVMPRRGRVTTTVRMPPATVLLLTVTAGASSTPGWCSPATPAPFPSCNHKQSVRDPAEIKLW